MPVSTSTHAKTKVDKLKKSLPKRKVESAKEHVSLSRFTENLPRNFEIRLRSLAKSLTEPGKGILAVDESVDSVDNCLRSMKISGTETNRMRYLDVVLGSRKELCYFLSGVLFREEMTKLKFYRSRPITYTLNEVGIHVGIRVDKGFTKLPGTFSEWATVGLDDLDSDCKRFRERGATFTLWRCVYKVTWCTPSQLALTENSNSMAKFASFCQTAGLVPVLSVELLPDGDYDQRQAQDSLRAVLVVLMKALHDYHVYLEGVIIRLTPTFPGAGYPDKYTMKNVVESTLRICNRCIPEAVAGIMLPRRGTLLESVEILNELNKCYMKKPPSISFCFSRVIHEDIIKTWGGQDACLEKARKILVKRVEMCSLGTMGQFPEANGSLFISNISES